MGFKDGNSHQSCHYIPSDLLDDLCSRFIINLPLAERCDLVRLCFHVEMAHWFYLDNYCKMYNLRPCGQRTFAGHIFQHIPELNRHVKNLDTVLGKWRAYKRTIPTYGAILLDEELSHVLLVQSFSAKTSWGFPKGKVNQDEKPWNCAAREVLEETGFDISKLINKREYINTIVKGQRICLYIITNIPRDTNFKPLTQNEIKSCEWFRIKELPLYKKDMTPKVKTSVGHNAFIMVMPFLKKIRRWVYGRNLNESTRGSCQHSMSSIKFSTTKTKIGISHGRQNAATNQQKQNFPMQETENDFMQYQDQDHSTQELHIAYKKYLQQNQPFEKFLNMARKHQQQNCSYYKYQDGQLYQVQNSPMTPNNSHIWSTNTSDNNLTNLEKYYQQDLPTQYLKNALMICEHQDFPYFEFQDSQLYQEHSSSPGWTKNTSETNLSMNESKLSTRPRLMTPSEFTSSKTVQKEHSCDEYYDKLSNFVAPSWADFKFDKKAVLDSMT